jgi:hypothetical protein
VTPSGPPPSQSGAGLARVHHTTQEGTTVTQPTPAAELYVLLRKAGVDRHEAQALIDAHAAAIRTAAGQDQPHDRSARYAEALARCGAGLNVLDHLELGTPDAVMAVADTEQRDLRAERDHLRAAQPGNARLYDTAVHHERENARLRAELAQARGGVLAEAERRLLARVLKQVGEEALGGDDFTEDDRAALATLHRMAAEAQHTPAETTPPVHLAAGTNAEDCPACKGTNPDYPFLCPGPTAEETTS